MDKLIQTNIVYAGSVNLSVKNKEKIIKSTYHNSGLSELFRLISKSISGNGLNLDDYIYSCLGPGKFNEYRHNECEKKYGIKLFKHNCGHSCRKCAHHNLLRYYENNENFPQEFIDKCWKIMSNNSYASRNMLFGDNIPLEQKIKNLYVE